MEGEPVVWDWADRIRKVRRVAGLTQADMARVAGVRAATWSAWESGRNIPVPDTAERVADRIAARFPVSADWLLGRQPDLQLSVLLPRMESNHQPPDCRPDAGHRRQRPGGRNLSHTFGDSRGIPDHALVFITDARLTTGFRSACRG